MTGPVAIATRFTRTLALLAVAGCALVALPAGASAAGPGSWTQAQVNAAIAKGIGYFDANQNSDGSWGSTDPGAETALALASYGVQDRGSFSNLTAAEQATVEKGMTFLLGTQGTDGSFNKDFLKTYDTGTALLALSLLPDVPTTPANAIATAITKARNYLIANQNIPANGISCQTTGMNGSGLGGQEYCGGWNYNEATTRSDESNTGFALTGLDVTGGVPAAVASANVGWQRNVQQLTSNPGGFTARNDGGGAYTPGTSTGDFSSNANDTGSLLFGFGYDGVPATDPSVQAAIKFGNDVFDAYELNTATRTMIFHTGTNEDGVCVIGAMGCDWQFGSGEGGYHYSIFALVKGLGQYIPPNLSDATNYYAKAVDLLLTQQNTDGSWPADLRDDGSIFGATGFAILALGKVGAGETITATPHSVTATEGKPFTATVATFTDPDKNSTASEYSATIDWGDGKTSTGTVTGTGGSFTVTGTNVYTEEGTDTIKVTITDVDNTPNNATVSGSATVGDAALHAKGTGTHTASSGRFSGKVATFTDANPFGTVSNFTAKISWGDGSTSTGKVTGASGNFSVKGSHKYGKSGRFTVKVKIKDDGGSTASATTVVIVGASGRASLLGLPVTCASGPFTARVSGSRIARVTVTLDSATLATRTVQRGRVYTAMVPVPRGAHRLIVRVTFAKGTSPKSRTITRTVIGCVPTFTG